MVRRRCSNGCDVLLKYDAIRCVQEVSIFFLNQASLHNTCEERWNNYLCSSRYVAEISISNEHKNAKYYKLINSDSLQLNKNN